MIANKNTQDYVEEICEQGCKVVMQYIDCIDKSQPPTTNSMSIIQDVSNAQRLEISKELKAIMAVYENKGCQR